MKQFIGCSFGTRDAILQEYNFMFSFKYPIFLSQQLLWYSNTYMIWLVVSILTEMKKAREITSIFPDHSLPSFQLQELYKAFMEIGISQQSYQTAIWKCLGGSKRPCIDDQRSGKRINSVEQKPFVYDWSVESFQGIKMIHFVFD